MRSSRGWTFCREIYEQNQLRCRFRTRDAERWTRRCRPRTGNEDLYNESCAASYWQFFFFRRQHLDRRRNPFRDRVSNRVPNGRLILR